MNSACFYQVCFIHRQHSQPKPMNHQERCGSWERRKAKLFWAFHLTPFRSAPTRTLCLAHMWYRNAIAYPFLRLPSRLENKLLTIWLFCPENSTAVLTGFLTKTLIFIHILYQVYHNRRCVGRALNLTTDSSDSIDIGIARIADSTDSSDSIDIGIAKIAYRTAVLRYSSGTLVFSAQNVFYPVYTPLI